MGRRWGRGGVDRDFPGGTEVVGVDAIAEFARRRKNGNGILWGGGGDGVEGVGTGDGRWSWEESRVLDVIRLMFTIRVSGFVNNVNIGSRKLRDRW